MKSPMDHTFSEVPALQQPRSVFKRDRSIKTAFYAGLVVPVFGDEVLPGDTWSVSFDAFVRMATLIKPIMHNVYMDVHFWYCPNRIIHKMALGGGWERLQGQQENPGDSVDVLTPIINNAGGWYAVTNSLFDYFGVPVGVANLTICSYLMRAYNLTWDNNYRDENLQNGTGTVYGDGPDDPGLFSVRPRGKRHDYFTAAALTPQKGAAVQLPLGSTAPVTGTFTGPSVNLPLTPIAINFNSPGDVTAALSATAADPAQMMIQNTGAGAGGVGVTGSFTVNADDMTFDLAGQSVTVDLSGATAADMNLFRVAVTMQQALELDMRGGTRYSESLQSRWGVTSPDGRLQLPEFLGGGTVPVNVHPVQQTSNTGATGTPQGNLAAFATASTSGIGFKKSFTEHGVIFGIVSVRADLTYQQGLHRMFSRRTRFDFYEPIFAHLGEQAILNKEIFADGSSADDDAFGYQERWAEYRYGVSMVTGIFRSNVTAGFTSLDVWHLAQDFVSLPALGASFIEEAPPISRVVSVPSEPNFILDGFFNVKTARVMPTYSVPGLTRI